MQYSLLHLHVMAHDVFFRDYSGRGPVEILRDFSKNPTCAGFAGEQAEDLTAWDHATAEQQVTEADCAEDAAKKLGVTFIMDYNADDGEVSVSRYDHTYREDIAFKRKERKYGKLLFA